jgi:filamentous hemagglutinin family protein
MRPRLSKVLLLTTALVAAAVVALATRPGAAGPQGPSVVGGTASVTGAGTANVTVNQTSSSTIINWNTFNIGVNERVNFVQPSSSSIALNRVTGGLGPSEILGTLTANGRVFVINRDGVLIGPNAVINTGSFLASTHDIANSDFMAGRMNFNIPGRSDASIVNLGRITASTGGFAALVAPGVRNSGTITATLGTVGLAASGKGFTLDLYGDKLITLKVDDEVASKVIDVATGQPLNSLVTNTGRIRANGGRVELTAAAARTVVDSVINTSGVIQANSIGQRNGMIVLSAGTAGSKPKGAPVQTIRISGTISASGKKKGTTGGTIVVSGEDIKLASARIDASGQAGGGKVLIGGDWGGGNPKAGLVDNQSAKLETFVIPTASTVSVDAGTTINASSTGNGNGGKVILWSDTQTTFAGTILANGGPSGGNGGFVETSSHGQLNFTGNVNTLAPNGRTGTLLLDPADYYINPDSGGPTPPSGASVITRTVLQGQLANNDVVIATDNNANPVGQFGDIRVNTSLGWSSSHSLTLSAYRDIRFLDGVTMTSSGGGSIVLRADNTGTSNGTVSFGIDTQAHINVSNGGSVSIYYNPDGYTSPTDYSGNVSISGGGRLTAYMLVNNESQFESIGQNTQTLAGTYALGRGFSLLDFGGFATGTTFTGTFDGNGGLGVNYKLTDVSLSSKSSPIGLFPFIGSSGTVRNLDLDKVTITAGGDTQIIGVVAGQNDGIISNVRVLHGTVDGGTYTGILAGGLVGQNTGTVTGSSSGARVTVGDGETGGQANYAGGLIGVNRGIVDGSTASGTIASGFNSFAGGLVGWNSFRASITNSSASGAVSGVTGRDSDFGSGIGGLVGFNQGSVSGSFATGAVSGTTETTSQRYAVIVGGLVGLNNGQVTNSYASGNVTADGIVQIGGLVGGNFGPISASYATGRVNGSGNGTVGGLVGLNGVATVDEGPPLVGSITGSHASGQVSGSSGDISVGGLAGQNDRGASVANSVATGALNISATTASDQLAGGLVGQNEGRIIASYATGAVNANGGDAIAGGLVGASAPGATISSSYATGDVTIVNGATLVWGGGLVGGNGGVIDGISFATGNVSVSAQLGLAGGLLGYNVGSVFQAYATGKVNVGGTFGIAGGFTGVNNGFLNQTFATGAVTSTAASSVLGGFVGVNTNAGNILQAFSTGAVTGDGSSTIGGFAAVNVGTLDQTYAIGKITGGGLVGGLVASNTSAPLPPSLTNDSLIGPTLTGTGTATTSYWDTQTTGVATSAQGNGVPTTGLIASLPPGFDHSVWTIQPDPSYPYFPWQGAVTIPTTNEPVPPIASRQPQIIDNLINTTTFANLNTTSPLDPGGGVRQPQFPPPQPPGGPPGAGQQPQQIFQRIIDIPPLTETRFVPDQVLVQIRCDTGVPRVEEAVRRLGLSLLATQDLCTTAGSVALQFRITNGQDVRAIIRRLASVQIVAIAQPVYLYETVQEPAADPAAPASRGNPQQQGSAEQYILQKLQINDVHRIVRGTNVPIAVIDSEIDANHPDLQGVIAQRFSAVGAPEKPHLHGTGMAGAIASHQRLMGIAPSARIYAVLAFSPKAATAESTTFNILKGIDWAQSQGVRVINMSFAGPKDPSLERSLKAAYDKGIVLIAAAGNAGPKSPPLYPGADPNVIAVTATDADDKIFSGANRGKYISVAAPGVDILVPAPDNAYQLTTGTSVAAAEVSGIAALLLERNPRLTPADIRRILTGSAKRLGPGERNDDFGSGLVDVLKAVQSADPRVVTSPPIRQR